MQCIKGYQAQSDLVGQQLTSVIKSFVDLRSSLIVEGVHLSIPVMLNLVQQFPNVVPFLVYIKKEDFHRQRFAVRAKYMTTDPMQNRYISHFDSIRCVQSCLSEGASQHLLPKIDNRNIDRSLETMHQTIFSYLKKLKGRKSMYDESTQKLSFLYSVWKRRKQKITSKSKSLKAIKSMKKGAIEEPQLKPSNLSDESANLIINNTNSDEINLNASEQQIEYKVLYDELQAALPVEGKRVSSDGSDGGVIQYLKNGSMLMVYEPEVEVEEPAVKIKHRTSNNEISNPVVQNQNLVSSNESISSIVSTESLLPVSQSQGMGSMNVNPSILTNDHSIEVKSSSQNLSQQKQEEKSDENSLHFENITVEKAVSDGLENQGISKNDNLNLNSETKKKNSSSTQQLNTTENNLSNNNSQNLQLNTINANLVNSNESTNSSSQMSNGQQNNENFSANPMKQTTSMIMNGESQKILNRRNSDVIPVQNDLDLNSQIHVSYASMDDTNALENAKENSNNNISAKDDQIDVERITDDSSKDLISETINDNFNEFPDTETDVDPAEVTLTDFVETTDSEAVDWKSFLAACGNNKNFFNFNIHHQQSSQQQQQTSQQSSQQHSQSLVQQTSQQHTHQQPPPQQQPQLQQSSQQPKNQH